MSDWVSMGFSERSIPILMELLEYTDIHENNPYQLLKLLQAIPTKEEALHKFNDEYSSYGLTFHTHLHPSIKQSLITSMSSVTYGGLIIPPIGTDDYEKYGQNKEYVQNWGALAMEYPHLNINLNILTSGGVTLARASVGKILDKLVPYLYKLKPLIVVEEADFIAPNTQDTETITSLYQLRNYVLKHQRTGVELMFISQDPNLLDQFIVLGGTIWIMGQHVASMSSANVLNEPKLNYVQDVIHKLRHDRYRGIREFALMESGNDGRYKIFQSHESITRLPSMHKVIRPPRAFFRENTYYTTY
jgi:hypothetical protein